MGTYKGRTGDEWRAQARGKNRDAAESFERCDTDGFLSQWASDMTAKMYDRYAQLADQEGQAEFPALFDLDGVLLDARLVQGKYGWVWCVSTPDGVKWFNESYARKGARRLAADEAKGYRVGTVCTAAHVRSAGNRVNLNYFFAPNDDAPREVIDNGTGGSWYQDRI